MNECSSIIERVSYIDPSNTELNPICHLMALLGAPCNPFIDIKGRCVSSL